MKKIYYATFVLLVLIGVAIVSCTKDINENSNGTLPEEEILLSVDEAKTFFENQTQKVLTRSTQTGKGLYNINFTPNWKDAETSCNEDFACVDVNILTNRKFRVYRSRIHGNHTHVSVVDIEQKLAIVKHLASGTISQTLLTYIPEQNYAKTHKGNFTRHISFTGDNRSDFCGIIIYSAPLTNKVLGIKEVTNGKSIRWVPLYNKTSEQIKSTFKSVLGYAQVKQINNVLTRSWDDEDGGDDGWFGGDDGDDEWFGGNDGEDQWGYGGGDDDEDNKEEGCPICGGGGCSWCNLDPLDPWEDDFCPACGSTGCDGSCLDAGDLCSWCGGSGCEMCSGEGSDPYAIRRTCPYCKVESYAPTSDGVVYCRICQRQLW